MQSAPQLHVLAMMEPQSLRVSVKSTRFLCVPIFHVLCLLVGVFVYGPTYAQPPSSAQTPATTQCEALNQADRLINGDFADQAILRIEFVNLSVFDLSNPDENTLLYRFLNKLHRNTRKEVIQGQLLFKVGDKLEPDLLAESGRLLREKRYLASAKVHVVKRCQEGVVVQVVTRDVWTTEPQITVSREGDESKTGFALTEKNVAGTGNTISVGHLNTADRAEVFYNFFSPHILNSRIALRLAHSDNSDGQNNIVEVQKPFYSLQTKWAAGFSTYDITQTERIRYLDDTFNRFRHEANVTEAFAGLKLYGTSSAVHRAKIGVTHNRHVFSELDTSLSSPENYNIVSSWLEYEYLENKFVKYRNLNYLHRVEDIATGRQLRLRLGYGQDRSFNKEDVWTTALRYSDVLYLTENQLLSGAIHYDGFSYRPSAGRDEQLYGAYLEYFYLIDDNDRWYGRIQYRRGRDLRQHNELTLGGEEGLRGYPLDFLRGSEQTVLTIERRKVTDLHIFNLLRVGMLAFYEVGRISGAPYDNSFFLSNIGVGLRVASSKARIGNVVHIDLAYPLAKNDDIKSLQFVVKASQRF